MPTKKGVSKSQPSLPDTPPPELKGAEEPTPKDKGQGKPQLRGGELFIVDNSDEDWKVVDYLQQWTEISNQFDIATGYFEIGSLLALDGHWKKLEKIRILMGDEVSRRTKKAFEDALAGITEKLDASIEAAKDDDDFLSGVPAIVEAIQSGKIEARVYRKKKFHAKAYITHAKYDVVGSSALVGSSNFTFPGLHNNVELNVQLRREVEELQEWYETHWEQAEDVSPDILRTIERHIREYMPFDVYARAMVAYFRSHELSVSEWEKTESRMYGVLDQYQREGYHRLMQIGAHHKGALLCDGVGLGKTFIGLMVIERLLFERKTVALFVPKAARDDLWEVKLRRYLPKARGRLTNLVVYNHTDLLREGDYQDFMQEVAEEVDAIVVDEAHHFRNTSSQRYRKFFEITKGKQIFLLTATPINNTLYDLLHLIELFSRRQPDYFRDAPLGLYSLLGHFRKMEAALEILVGGHGVDEIEIDPVAAEEILSKDDLFQSLVVQRSRAYVKRSLAQEGGNQVSFPVREDPRVADYSLAKTYGGLLDRLKEAFNKREPLVSLPIYYPLAYYIGDDPDIDPLAEGRQRQVVGLIRTLLLKRFESSAIAFEASCEYLLFKLLYFVRIHSEYNPRTVKRWENQHAALLERIFGHLKERGLFNQDREEELEDDIIPEEFKKKIEKLDDEEYNVSAIIMETLLDMDQLARFLDELQDFDPSKDDKLQTLIHMMQTDPNLRENKVLIFTEYQATARYIASELETAGIGPLAQVDGQKKNASAAIHAFSPYYNESSSVELNEKGIPEIRVLVSTDVLAEGLNLQDATCIINYDLHWNPVRLMQRIGRVDRRLDQPVENQILIDHPELVDIRGTVHLWNFLPPEELNDILTLYERVTHKTLRISKTFGIEGRKLLTPQDDYDALREFNQHYEGTTSSTEEMYLTYQQLLQDYPDLVDRMRRMPLRLFSGKAHPSPNSKAVFFCYRLPAKDAISGKWDIDSSFTHWYIYDLDTEEINEDATQIFPVIQSDPDTPRKTATSHKTLSEIRHKLDQHITNTYLKKVQAPIGVNATLLAWMELI
ncbi:helicase-related protein [Chloroflexota bacterium]